jgi:hypothetical protein
MPVRAHLSGDDTAAIHVAEALLASFIVLSALTLTGLPSAGPADAGLHDMETMASDLIDVMEHRDSRPGHPSLASVMTSAESWNEESASLESDLREFVPWGTWFCLTTPYGSVGDRPPDGVVSCARPFQAYCRSDGRIVDCCLTIWRV